MSGAARKLVKAVLFDKDGTLVDFNGTWHALYEKLALEITGGDVPRADQLLVIGGFDPATGSFIAGSELAAGTTPGIVRLWLPEADEADFLRWCARLDHAFVEEGPVAAVPIAGLEDTVKILHAAGIILAVVTNDLEEAAENTMKRFGLRSYFAAILGYDSVIDPKPAAGPVLKFCDITGIAPHEVLVIGDNRHDIEMARNAGAAYAIGVLSGTGTSAVLSCDADAVLNSIADLPEWLGLR
ncbi:MAG: HAD family hydrolase [Rhizobiaceae bacterium]